MEKLTPFLAALGAALLALFFLVSPFDFVLHADFMPSAVFLFVNALAVAYLSSLTKARSSWPLSLLGLLPLISTDFAIPVLVAMALFSFWCATKLEDSARLSAAGAGLAYLYALPWAFYGTCSYFLIYPIAMIFAVSLHTFPRTFRERPFELLGYASLLTHPLFFFSHYFLALSLAMYFVAAKYYKLREFCSFAKGVGGVAGRGLSYYCYGHAFALASVTYPFLFKGLSFLHAFMLGFVSIHIFIHMPTMLPPLLGIPNARRYNLYPYVLSLAASASWPFFKDLAWLLYALALGAALYVFLPNPLSFKRGQRKP